MNYYVDKQYADELPENAVKDLKILFFDSFLKDCKKILDIGCSVGRIISIDPKRIHGIDFDKKAIEIAKKKNYNVKFADATKKLPFYNGSFDAVYCSQLIEHMENPLFLVKEIKRILKKNGRAIIITPDYIMSHKNNKNGFWNDYTHKKPFTKNSLKRIAYDAGFKKFRVYHFPGKGWRNLIRLGVISKEFWIKIENLPFMWKGQDLILEVTK